ncbi:hypothetical protein SeMB42_g04576 [Synchytrium endobioticum]|uniref:RhoGAP-domain-containing protein n=1 Tax=Synchytrium endobioticum TaxID=286115 RepID=A0A507CY51_9FUNG|nr:hypothetical protein SeLEV6574_g06963 [Synchytrium endobioticum]TPX43820.1 hypothetical protein SeMB42_g04576 [Synchytrium endobioticum]
MHSEKAGAKVRSADLVSSSSAGPQREVVSDQALEIIPKYGGIGIGIGIGNIIGKIRMLKSENGKRKHRGVSSELETKDARPRDSTAHMDPSIKCIVCGLPIGDDASGAALSLGDNSYHLSCFRCSSCGTAIGYEDQPVLLSSDHKPLCINCCYSCDQCGHPILEDAVITGNHTFHVDCFKCGVCGQFIENLTFTTIQDTIHCMACTSRRTSTSIIPSPEGHKPLSSVSVSSPLARESPPLQRNDSRLSRVASEALSVPPHLEQENKHLRDKLLVAEANRSKAMDEFASIKQDLANEILQRQSAEMTVTELKLEISEILKSNARLVQMDEALNEVHQNINMIMSQKTALEGQLKQMALQKEILDRDIRAVTRRRDQSISEASLAQGVPVATEVLRDAELDSIESRFRAEVAQIQEESNSLSTHVSNLRNTRDALQAEVDKLKAEKTLLLMTNETLTLQTAIINQSTAIPLPPMPNTDAHISTRPLQSKSVHDFSVEELPTQSPRKERVNPDVDAIVESISTDALAAVPEDVQSAATGLADSASSKSGDNSAGPSSTSSLNTTKRHHHNHKALPTIPLDQDQGNTIKPILTIQAPSESAVCGQGSDTPVPLYPPLQQTSPTSSIMGSWKSHFVKATKINFASTTPTSKSEVPLGLPADSSSPALMLGSMWKHKKASGGKPAEEFSTLDPHQLSPEKARHRLVPHTYVRQNKCDVCLEKLWGKEMRCEACGYHAHNKCIPTAPSNCPGSQQKTSLGHVADVPVIFGTDLSKLYAQENHNVPKIVRQCIAHVEERGLDFEGIYRKSGPLTQINKLIATANRGEDLVLSDEENPVDIMAVTSALKQFFRDLPESLLPCDLYTEFAEMLNRKEETDRMSQAMTLLQRLPAAHLAVCQLLFPHLYKITQHRDVNLMTPTNLGVVFGPTLMKSPSEKQATTSFDMADSSTKCNVVEYLVTHAPSLFASAGAPLSSASSDGETVSTKIS